MKRIKDPKNRSEVGVERLTLFGCFAYINLRNFLGDFPFLAFIYLKKTGIEFKQLEKQKVKFRLHYMLLVESTHSGFAKHQWRRNLLYIFIDFI